MPDSGSGIGIPVGAPGGTPVAFSVVPCQTRYASAWEYVTFWCRESILTGASEGGPAVATLTDSDAQFKSEGIVPNVGMILYNVTQNTAGEVTAVTETTLTATGVTWNVNDIYRLVAIDSKRIALI